MSDDAFARFEIYRGLAVPTKFTMDHFIPSVSVHQAERLAVRGYAPRTLI